VALQAAALPEGERLQVLRQVCGSSTTSAPDSTSIETRGDSRASAAFVRCAPHRVESRLLVANVATCTRERRDWQCAPAREAMLVTLPDGSSLAVTHADLSADAAVGAILEATRLTVPPFHKHARQFMKEQCNVRQLPESLFAGATHFVVTCPALEMAVTRHCHQGNCRWFVAEGREPSVPRG
jgi:hypothetical protein